MCNTPRIRRRWFVRAPRSSQPGGLIGWVTFSLQDGRLVNRTPVRSGLQGYPVFVWAATHGHARRDGIADRKAIECALLSMFGWWFQAETKVGPGKDRRRDLSAAPCWLAEDLSNGLAVPAVVERHQFDDRAKESLR